VRITVLQEDLSPALQTVQRAISPRTTLPVLTGILIEGSDDQLRLVATDLELGIERYVPAEIGLSGAIVLPARYLVDLVRKIPSGAIHLEIEDSSWTATARWGRSEFILHGLSPDQFPQLPAVAGQVALRLSQSLMREMIRQTIFCISQDESRPVLTGVLVHIRPDFIEMVSTDGVRLSVRRARVPLPVDAPWKAIIPGRSLAELNRALSGEEDEVELVLGENQCAFRLPNIRFTSRLIDGQFPKYDEVIPQHYPTRARLKTRDFHDACERAALLSPAGPNPILIDLSDEGLAVSAVSQEVGRVREELDASVEGEQFQVSFNARYLIEALRALEGEEVWLESTGPLSPSRLRAVGDEDFFHILLPLRPL